MTSKKKIISTVTLALMLSAGVAAAQTTNPTTYTGTDQVTGQTTQTSGAVTSPSGMTGATGSSTTGTGTTLPGTPNTGAGGDAGSTLLTLIASAFAAIVGAAYLATRKPLTR